MATHFLLRAQLLRDRVRSFEDYPFSLPAFRALDTIVFHPAVTFLIGENGTGKSTLLEAIAVAWGLNAEGGSRNPLAVAYGLSRSDDPAFGRDRYPVGQL
jgi:predicted ATPase